MNIKMCVTNLDLFSTTGDDKYVLKQLLPDQRNAIEEEEFALEEVHCLGSCYLCQCGPTAFVDDRLIHKD
jgi:NADH:ubiquinone oxidoreductase subunit E